MFTLPPPVVPAGVVPFDIAAWKARRQKPQPPEPAPVAQVESARDDEAEWLEWHLKATAPQPMSNDELRALAVTRGKSIAPGTIDQHDEYIREYRGKEYGETVCAYRQFAIFGIWADGSKKGPALPAIGFDRLKWLAGQAELTKYLKWYRAVDLPGFMNWVEAHPSYRPQAGLPPLVGAESSASLRGAA